MLPDIDGTILTAVRDALALGAGPLLIAAAMAWGLSHSLPAKRRGTGARKPLTPREQAEREARAQHAAQASAEARHPILREARHWMAMPGRVLERRDGSGHQIQHYPGADPEYVLWSPEGRPAAMGCDLRALIDRADRDAELRRSMSSTVSGAMTLMRTTRDSELRGAQHPHNPRPRWLGKS